MRVHVSIILVQNGSSNSLITHLFKAQCVNTKCHISVRSEKLEQLSIAFTQDLKTSMFTQLHMGMLHLSVKKYIND